LDGTASPGGPGTVQGSAQSYGTALMLAAGALVLVLALYVAFVAGVAGLLLWHGFNNTGLLQSGTGTLLYLVPLVAGFLLLLLLLKPLLAPPSAPPPSRSIDHTSHPRLFQLIGVLCREVGAHPPSRVEVDGSVNASVSFREGWASVREHDLVLCIGLPLVAGLSTRELAGIIAHEFGHFRQGAGLRLSFMVRRLSHWFWRVAHERDQIDDQINEAIESSPSFVVLIFFLPVSLGFRLTRRFLHLLMLLAHAASCRLLRQMEFDADAQEIRVAGTAAFLSSSRRLRRLTAAHASTQFQLVRAWRERQLPDNLPELIRHIADTYTPQQVEAIEAASAASVTGLFSTHPSDPEREAAAMALDEPGCIDLEGPASDLFNDFPALCREVTREFYEGILGIAPEPGRMTSVEASTGAVDEAVAAQQHLTRYAPGTGFYGSPIPWDPAALSEPTDLADLHAAIASGRVLVDAAPPGEELEREKREAGLMSIRLYAARQLDAATIRWEAGMLELPSNDPATLAVLEEEAERRMETVNATLAGLLPAIGTRLRAALQLWWHDPRVASDPRAENARDQVLRLLPVLIHVGAVAGQLQEIERDHATLHEVLLHRKQCRDAAAVEVVVDQLSRGIRRNLREILPRMSGVPHPFMAGDRHPVTIRQLLDQESHARDGLGGALSEAGAVRSMVPGLYRRSLAALATLAGEAEQKAGIGG